MQFVINGLKYDTEKMEKVADVKKWYQVDNIFTRAAYPGKEVGRMYDCELWKSAKGNWLLTHEEDYTKKIRPGYPGRGSQKPFNEICNGYLRKVVWRFRGSIKTKRNPVAKVGT